MEIIYNQNSVQFNQRKRKESDGERFEVGSMDAGLSEDIVAKHKMEAALKRFASQLIKQMDCDGVILNGITFQRVWFK